MLPKEEMSGLDKPRMSSPFISAIRDEYDLKKELTLYLNIFTNIS